MKKVIVIGSGKLVSIVGNSLMRINEEVQVVNVDNGIANTKHHLTESECTEITAIAKTLEVEQTMTGIEISLSGFLDEFKIDPKKIQKEQSQQGWKHRNKYRR